VAREAAASGLRFFLDRGLSALIVPRALRQAGWNLETMDERAQVVYMSGARAFALSNASLAGADMARWYLKHEAQIVRTAMRVGGPYVMAVNPSYGLRRTRLAYPPG
jgi:hypothetical protein